MAGRKFPGLFTKKLLQVHSCIPRVQKIDLRKNVLFLKKELIFYRLQKKGQKTVGFYKKTLPVLSKLHSTSRFCISFGPWAVCLWYSTTNFSAGLSKLTSTCPFDQFEIKKLVWKTFNISYQFRKWLKNVQPSSKTFRRGHPNCIPRVYSNLSKEKKGEIKLFPTFLITWVNSFRPSGTSFFGMFVKSVFLVSWVTLWEKITFKKR